jgi:hypothetical protein
MEAGHLENHDDVYIHEISRDGGLFAADPGGCTRSTIFAGKTITIIDFFFSICPDI